MPDDESFDDHRRERGRRDHHHRYNPGGASNSHHHTPRHKNMPRDSCQSRYSADPCRLLDDNNSTGMIRAHDTGTRHGHTTRAHDTDTRHEPTIRAHLVHVFSWWKIVTASTTSHGVSCPVNDHTGQWSHRSIHISYMILFIHIQCLYFSLLFKL